MLRKVQWAPEERSKLRPTDSRCYLPEIARWNMEEKPKGKMRYCNYCGEELGVIEDRNWLPEDAVCGKHACQIEARADAREERREAHEKLDQDLGWI